MTDITVTLSPVQIVSYVTYYSVSTTSQIALYMTSPVNMSYTVPSLGSISIGSGIYLTVFNPVMSQFSVKDVDYVRALSALGHVVRPSLGSNVRTNGTSIDSRQVLSVRGEKNTYSVDVVNNSNNIDNISNEKRKEANSLILSKANSRPSAVNILRTLSNRFSV